MSDLIQRVLVSLSDRYEVERPLGGGGMAAVFLAIDRKHGRQVALKIFDPDLTSKFEVQRFLREIRVTARLQHPHVLPLLDSGEQDGVPYYVTPFVEGESLRARLDREKRLSLEDVRSLTQELASALDYAHAHGVVHRDIKPANILLSGGHAIVADFGIARAALGSDDRSLTRTGSSVGTPLYMSPEQVAGADDLDGRADQYALGCVVYEMLAGAPPFAGPTADSVAYQHMSVPAPPVTNLRPGLPPRVVEAVARALAKVPADRYTSLAAFAAALQESAAVGESDETRTLPSRPARPLGPVGGRRVAILSIAAVVVVVVMSAWLLWRRREPVDSPIRAIAVLPLEDLTGDEARLVFADGLTEELITELSKIRSIRVTARSAVMRYRSTRTSLRKVAQELHVDALVEGSVVRAGNHIRITARLIDPSHEQERWSQSYEREIRDVLALQADVAQAVAKQMRGTLTPEEVTRFAAVRPVLPVAHEAALRGFYLLDRIDGTNYQKALEYFEEAIRGDPTYAMAWAGLADTYYLMSSIYLPAAEAVPKARAAAGRALEIDPDLAPALTTLAMLRAQYDFDWVGADSSFGRAITLNPSLAKAHAYYAYVLSEQGRFDASETEWKKAVELDPFSTFYATGLGSPFLFSGRHAQAAAIYEDVIRRDSTYAVPRLQLAITYSAMGRHEEAIREARRALSLSDNPYALSILGSVYAKAGRSREALASIARMRGGAGGRVQGVWMAHVYAALGRREEALAALEQSVRDHDEDALMLAVDPVFASLRGDPRFQDVMRRVNLKD